MFRNKSVDRYGHRKTNSPLKTLLFGLIVLVAGTVASGVIASTASAERLSLIKTPASGGTVSSSPSGIFCGWLTPCSSASADFPSGQTVDLNASPRYGHYVRSVTGCDWSSPTPPTASDVLCRVGMTRSRSVFVTFAPNPTIRVIKTPTAGGTVTSSPSGLVCGSLCTAGFSPGTSVTLSVRPMPGYRFDRWSGACSGSTSTCSIPMSTASRVVGAIFRRS